MCSIQQAAFGGSHHMDTFKQSYGPMFWWGDDSFGRFGSQRLIPRIQAFISNVRVCYEFVFKTPSPLNNLHKVLDATRIPLNPLPVPMNTHLFMPPILFVHLLLLITPIISSLTVFEARLCSRGLSCYQSVREEPNNLTWLNTCLQRRPMFVSHWDIFRDQILICPRCKSCGLQLPPQLL